jgi:tetratricopeptide (TPR) repeat protein
MIVAIWIAAALFAQQSVPPPPPFGKPLGGFDDPNGGPPSSMHSVGVRGAIDAGGYAASSTVKAQTELFRQLADVQVAALQPTWDWCAHSKASRRPAIDLLRRGEFTSAAAGLETLLRTDPDPAIRQVLGLAYEGNGQLEAAAEQFRLAAEASHENSALFAYGSALLLMGQADRAETIFRTGGSASLTRLGLGAAAFQHGNVDEALELFLAIAADQPLASAPFGFIAVAVRSARPSASSEAVTQLSSLTKRYPENAGAHYALACALMAGGATGFNQAQTEHIEQELERAISVDPTIADAHFRLAAVYASRQKIQAAITEYRAALDQDARLVEAHYRLSQLYARSGEPRLAEEQLRLHQELRAQQKAEVENGKVPIRISETVTARCP